MINEMGGLVKEDHVRLQIQICQEVRQIIYNVHKY